MSLQMIDGFEHGLLSTAGGGLYSAIADFGTVQDIVTSPVKTGGRCLRQRNASRLSYAIPTATNIVIVGGWFRIESIPVNAAGIDIYGMEVSGGTEGTWVQIQNDGTLRLNIYDGAATTPGSATSFAITTGVWHWVEFYLDSSANPWVSKARIDGVDIPTLTDAVVARDIAKVNLWHNAYNETGDLTRYYDDIVIYKGSASDYPISPKRIYPKLINGVATHNLEATPSKYYFKDIAGTETFLTSSETDSYQTIDDSPIDADVDHIGLKGVNIGIDGTAESHTGTTGSTNQASFDFASLTLGARCRGILVFTFNANSNANDATSVKINPATNNIDVPAVAGSLATDTLTEPGSCRAWFIGAGLSAVAGTSGVVIRVNRNNNANIMYAVVISILADCDLETTGVAVLNDDGALAAQSVNDGSPGQNSLRFAGAYYGGASPPGVDGASSTLVANIDLGAFGCAVARETTQGQGARNVGFSAASDDRAYTVLAVRGVTPQAGTAHYVEYALENSVEVFSPLAIRTIAAMRQDVAQTCAVDTLGYDGTTESLYENDLSIGSVTNIYRTTVQTVNPSGGAWKNSDLDGLRLRWGKTNNPQGIPRLAALQIEVLHDDVKRVASFMRRDAQHRKSRW